MIKGKIHPKGIIHSGGAIGADKAFGDIGTISGYEVIHHGFKGYQIHGEGIRKQHTHEELIKADNALFKANQTLKRSYPPKTEFDHMLLRRDYYQVIYSDFIIAIAPFEKKILFLRAVVGQYK